MGCAFHGGLYGFLGLWSSMACSQEYRHCAVESFLSCSSSCLVCSIFMVIFFFLLNLFIFVRSKTKNRKLMAVNDDSLHIENLFFHFNIRRFLNSNI